jgi:ABC-2 type transport system permease protein
MHEALVVMRRELRSYFLSPIAYVYGVVFVGSSLFFAAKLTFIQGQQASMQAFFSLLPVLLLWFVPGLTMRTWAEERKTGTLELLMTFPVRISQLIAGKFLAALIYLGIVLLFTIGIPITLSVYGKLDWGPVIAQYLASLLLAGSYLAVGMFWSSMTRDQIIAMILTGAVLLAMFFIGNPVVLDWLAEWMPSWLKDIIGAASPNRYFESISRGVFDSRDFVYYLCFTGFFLHANGLVLQARRQRG